MGSNSVEDVVNHLLAATTDRAPREVVAASARVYTTAIRNEIYAKAPGGRMRGVGKSGARVGVKATVQEGKNPTAIVQATGPLHLLERDTHAHAIPSVTKSRRTRTAAGRLSHKRESTGTPIVGGKVLFFNGVYRNSVHHPGTKGQHPFERGVNRGERDAVAAAVNAFSGALRSVYR